MHDRSVIQLCNGRQRDIRKSLITPKSFKLSAQNFDSSIIIMY